MPAPFFLTDESNLRETGDEKIYMGGIKLTFGYRY